MSLDAPIVSAGDRELPDLVDGPDMRDAVSGWSRPMVLEVVSLTAGKGGDAVEVRRRVDTAGFLFPAEPRKLDIKDEGEGTRKWRWFALYVLNDPHIRDGDKVEIDGVPFKAMKSWNLSQFGFMKYGVREDFR
jgi:hypothetical protein